MAMTNMRQRTTVAPLVAVKFFYLRPYFECGRHGNSSFRDFRISYKNKDALLVILALLRRNCWFTGARR
jgi:hypothetical protein